MTPRIAVVALLAVAVAAASWVVADEDLVVHDRLEVYGEAPSEFGRLWVPEGAGPFPVVVLVHGGFWRARVADLTLMSPLAEDLHGRGFAVWNIEYGRVGEREGGWPHTFVHAAAAVDHLADLSTGHRIDLDRVAIVGHSAGGHLALWVGGRASLRAGDPGSGVEVEPRLVVGLAPVVDLSAAAVDRVGRGAVSDLLGGSPTEVPDRYLVATPAAGVEAVVVVASDDDVVPARYSELPNLAARLVEVDGDHFTLIDPDSAAWIRVVALLEEVAVD